MGERLGWSFGFLVLLSGVPVYPGGISRFNKGFDPEAIVRRERHAVGFSDHVPDKSVTVCLDRAGLPVAVSRTVLTEVCKKGECLPVYLRLFWTVSGEYLGFAMEPGEVLTKYDHALFDTSDYDRLHALLNDPLSPLGNVQDTDIAPGTAPADGQHAKADVTSGATKRDIAPYTVGGAAYTTFTLWHLVYGETRDSIPGVVRNYITPGLVLSFLKSPSVQDKMWALSVTDTSELRNPELLEEISLNYREGDSYLRNNILETLLAKGRPAFVPAGYLASFFRISGFAQRRFILSRLEGYPETARDFIHAAVGDLESPEPPLVMLLLRLVRNSGIKQSEVRKWVERQVDFPDADVSRTARECIHYLDTH
ncbi:MAG: hypothetical protein ABS46_07670 [Cytophagaceae bacterium SCN 52-12]|nr:MAG: hypothetical protein ABS46_07670 [Cytophagaceae bacterium SCN 52-12]